MLNFAAAKEIVFSGCICAPIKWLLIPEAVILDRPGLLLGMNIRVSRQIA